MQDDMLERSSSLFMNLCEQLRHASLSRLDQARDLSSTTVCRNSLAISRQNACPPRDRASDLRLHETLGSTDAEIVIIVLLVTYPCQPAAALKKSTAAMRIRPNLMPSLAHPSSPIHLSGFCLSARKNSLLEQLCIMYFLNLSVSSRSLHRRIVVHSMHTFSRRTISPPAPLSPLPNSAPRPTLSH